jgi:hypothetical protein
VTKTPEANQKEERRRSNRRSKDRNTDCGKPTPRRKNLCVEEKSLCEERRSLREKEETTSKRRKGNQEPATTETTKPVANPTERRKGGSSRKDRTKGCEKNERRE